MPYCIDVEDPEWRWDGSFVYVTFKRPKNTAVSSKSANDTPINIATNSQNPSESKGESNQLKVINLLSENGKLTLPEVASSLNLSLAGVEKIVRQLKLEGIIYRKGSTKAGEWIVNKDLSSQADS